MLSPILTVLGACFALVGGVALYARQEVLRPAAFGDRAVQAVHQAAVQHVLAREIAVQVLEPVLPDLVAGRPAVDSAVSLAVSSKPFEPLLRLAAEHGRRLLFERHAVNAVFQVADAGTVVSSALRRRAPKLARDLPARTNAILLTVRRRSFVAYTLRLSEAARTLGIVLPPVAAMLFLLAVVLARDRRRAIVRSAVALLTTGLLFAVVYEICRRYVLARVHGSDGLEAAEVQAAAGAVWDAYLGDLFTWTLAVTVLSALVAAVAAPLFAPYDPMAGLSRLREWTLRSLDTRARGVRGAVAAGVGCVMIVAPDDALKVVAILGGGALVYVGLGELLSATARLDPRPRRRRPSRARAVALAGAATVTMVAVVLAVALAGSSSRARAAARLTCNGYAELCDRRLNEVVFAGTHNSMSAADSRGWFIANQDRALVQQLQDGIRLFKISTHYGVASPTGHVVTDIAASGQTLNRVAAKLPPAARAALQRLSLSISPGGARHGKRDVYLCHSLCELGATRMVDFLSTIRRFLDLNPGQVIILFDEDYVSTPDLARVFRRAHLFSRLASLQPGQPLPTLGELIRARHNVLVFAQKPESANHSWNPYAFDWIQDTPLGATQPQQFTCRLNRGAPNRPLLMMNNWADVFPPRPSPNLPLVKKSFILARARQCSDQRGMLPNLILTDYYDRGDVVSAVRTLNGLGDQAPAPTIRP